MNAKITDRDRGYRRLIRRLLGPIAKGPGVTVGIHEQEGAATPDGDVSIATYATINEFGLGVPERSFLRSTADENAEDYGKAIERAILDDLEGGRSVVDGLDRVGMRAVRDVKRKIRDLKEPANAESTIKKKGSSNPLVDQGAMRQAVTHRVVDV